MEHHRILASILRHVLRAELDPRAASGGAGQIAHSVRVLGPRYLQARKWSSAKQLFPRDRPPRVTTVKTAARKARNVNQKLNERSELLTEIREDLLDEIAAGKGPSTNAVTPPDPFRKNSTHPRNAPGSNAVTPPDPF